MCYDLFFPFITEALFLHSMVTKLHVAILESASFKNQLHRQANFQEEHFKVAHVHLNSENILQLLPLEDLH